jgi:hypothetical protein
MSLGNWGVFKLVKGVTFRGILAFYNSLKWGYFFHVFYTALSRMLPIQNQGIFLDGKVDNLV